MTTDLDPQACTHILSIGRYGHLGCCDGDEPYVVPITYVYDNGVIFGFTFEGRKTHVMREHSKVCVQVEDVVDGRSWVSVICWGTFEVVTGHDEAQRVRLLFGKQHGEAALGGEKATVSPGIDRLHSSVAEAEVLYRITPYRITGKRERS